MIRFNKNDLDEFKRTYFVNYTWTAVISWMLGACEYYFLKENSMSRKIAVIRWWHPITVIFTIQAFVLHAAHSVFKFFAEIFNSFKNIKKPEPSMYKRLSRIGFLIELIEFLKRNEENKK